jgi:hypothetical protein
MCILPPHPQSATAPTPAPAARLLPPQQRQHLALHALTGHNISQLAEEHAVSRKFIYQQATQAQQALQTAFDPPAEDDRILFSLPVTKAWLHQLTLGLVLICHSSFRGVVELFRDLFDYPMAVGTVHALVQQAVATDRPHNRNQDLSAIRMGAHDEIFQHQQPVLVGADVASTFCYLLSLEEHRDAETWGLRLRELHARGFQPDATIGDFAGGLRAGQALALPDTPCRGDVFPALQDLVAAVNGLEKWAYQVIDTCTDLERQHAQTQRRQGRADRPLVQKLRHARLADDVTVLVQWLRQDILAVAGPAAAERRQLYDFVVAELQARVPYGLPSLRDACRLLANHRAELLAFADQLDRDLTAVAETFHLSADVVRAVLHLQALDPGQPSRWQREALLRHQLGDRFHGVSVAVAQLAQRTVRASSVIENLNSRLRNYFFLRRHLGPDYLALLHFFLNHRQFLRSEHPERVDKSPRELLTGQPHPHWLELLGFTRFSRS